MTLSQMETVVAADERRLLVVDDDPDFAESLQDSLEIQGYTVKTAPTAAAAEACLKDFPAQVALLDIRLGGSDGVELIPRLKGRRPEIICVMVTGFGAVESAVAALREGAYDYMMKPLDPNDLKAMLGRCFERLDNEAEHRRAEEELKKYRDRLERLVEERTKELERARDDALESNRAKSDFLANMSHELRTPLTSIIGFSEILSEGFSGPLNEQQQRQLETIQRSASHLLGLINDILDLSKVEAGRLKFTREPFEVADLARELVELMRPLAENKGLVVDQEVNITASLHADRDKLRQVLLNLLGNAVKFTDQGQVTLRCSAAGDKVIFEVVDTGVGIEAAELQKIFSSFYQVKNQDDRKRTGLGTGLGLAISKRYVDLMGGTLTATSAPGQGSTFRIALPGGFED